MDLRKKQYVIKIDSNIGGILKKDEINKFSAFLAVTTEDGEQRMFSSSGFTENISGEPYLMIAGNKKRVEFVTDTKMFNAEPAPMMKGGFTLIYTLAGQYGLFVLQGYYDEVTGHYESVDIFIDLLRTDEMFGLADRLLKTCAAFGKTAILPEKSVFELMQGGHCDEDK